MVSNLQTKDLEQAATIVRRIWFCRNKFVFENKFTYPRLLVSEAITEVSNFQKFKSLLEVQGQFVKTVNRQAEGKNPMGSTLKANWHATLDRPWNKMGVRIIIRYNKGEVIVVCCRCVDMVISPMLAELMVLWRTLRLCVELGLHNVVFKGDARKTIEDIKAMEENWSPFGQLLEDIKFFIRSRLDWQLCFCLREVKIDAHRLAKYALSLNLVFFMINFVWLIIRLLLMKSVFSFKYIYIYICHLYFRNYQGACYI